MLVYLKLKYNVTVFVITQDAAANMQTSALTVRCRMIGRHKVKKTTNHKMAASFPPRDMKVTQEMTPNQARSVLVVYKYRNICRDRVHRETYATVKSTESPTMSEWLKPLEDVEVETQREEKKKWREGEEWDKEENIAHVVQGSEGGRVRGWKCFLKKSEMCCKTKLNKNLNRFLPECKSTPQHNTKLVWIKVWIMSFVYASSPSRSLLPGSSAGMTTVSWSLTRPYRPLVQTATTWTT